MSVLPRWSPHQYQARMVRFILASGAAGIFADPGMGKTATILAAVKVLKNQKIVRRTLVIAPLRVAQNVWRQEAAKWAEFSTLKVVLAHGPKKLEAITDPTADVVVMNVEAMPWLEAQWTPRSDINFDMLVVDESTKFKNSSTVRFKILRRLLPKFRRRYILTGTPIPNGLLDLFGQIYILDGGRSLGAYITHYRNRFFNATGYGGYEWVIRDGAAEEIYQLIKPLTLRLAAKDYLELPPLVKQDVVVDLPAEAQRVYDELEDEFYTELAGAGAVVTAVNAASLSSKLRQVASGGLYVDDETEQDRRQKAHLIHNAKTEAAVELVEQFQGSPALIAYDTHHDLERLTKAFPRAPHLGGGVTTRAAAAAIEAWNRGELPVFLVQPQSVSHGLNLQAGGHHLILYSLTWDLEAYEQLIARLLRQGQRQRVFLYHLVARGTIDEVMLRRLATKATVQELLLEALKARKGRK